MEDSDRLIEAAAERLKQTLGERRTFDTAQVRLVGLDDIRRAAGPNWNTVKDRVRSNSINFLQSALGEDGLVIPCGDGFLLIHREQPGRDLVAETETLQDALNAFYMGDEALQNVRAGISARRLSSREMVDALAKSNDASANHAAMEVRFTPVCNLTHEAITMYFATPVNASSGVMHIGYNPDYRTTGRHETMEWAELDLEILEHAISEASRVVESPLRCLIGYCVHVTTLKNRVSRERIFERLSRTPLHVRKIMLARISEIELGTPISMIIEWVGALRRFTPGVSLDFHYSEKIFDGLEETRASSAGFSLPLPRTVNTAVRARCRTLIMRWHVGLQRQRIRFHLDSVNDPLLLTCVVNEAVDCVSSDRYWPLTSRVEGVKPARRLSNERTLFLKEA